jgi:hypothetical protein
MSAYFMRFRRGVACTVAVGVALVASPNAASAKDTASSSSRAPAKSAAAAATRVRFSSGTSSKTISAQLVGSKTASFVIGAKQGQVMTLDTTPANTVVLTVVGPDGKILAGANAIGGMTGQLEKTGDFVVQIKLTPKRAKTNTSTTYRLRVAIEDLT